MYNIFYIGNFLSDFTEKPIIQLYESFPLHAICSYPYGQLNANFFIQLLHTTQRLCVSG